MTGTITLLGSTGSIGRQTVDIIRERSLKVCALTARSDVGRME